MPPLSAAPDGDSRVVINAVWFAKLRWVAALGQLITIAAVAGPMGVTLPALPLLLLVGVTLLTNGLFVVWIAKSRHHEKPRRTWQLLLAVLMLLDLVVLTVMLSLTGGTTNPFVVFFFVNLALSGVVLPVQWAWFLCALAIAAVALLTYGHLPVGILLEPDRLRSLYALQADPGGRLPLASLGAWVAFAASATVIVNFITRLTSELRTSDRLRRRAEQRRARAEKLEALGTLAAGAAHELATPLSTIAVAAAEVERELVRTDQEPEVVADMRLIRGEIARCRSILDRMSTESGQPAAGLPRRLTASELVDAVLAEIPARERVVVTWAEEAESLAIVAPLTALAQAVRAVVQNAIDATNDIDPQGTVRLDVDALASTLRLVITDQGPGMPVEVLARASEPFFTTKAPGQGMGLGLFLARSVVERLGGSLRHESPAEGGTVATIVLPREASR